MGEPDTQPEIQINAQATASWSMRKFFLGVLMAVVGLIVVGVLILLDLGFQLHREFWPTIANPVALQQDCQAYAKTNAGQEWPRQTWPRSLQALHPRNVYRENDPTIKIVISWGGGLSHGHDSWGYLVCADPEHPGDFDSEHWRLTRTKQPNILKFEEL